MTPEWSRCGEKVDYGTWVSAERARKIVSRVNRERNERKQIHVYRCPHCGGIHVGRDPGERSPEA